MTSDGKIRSLESAVNRLKKRYYDFEESVSRFSETVSNRMNLMDRRFMRLAAELEQEIENREEVEKSFRLLVKILIGLNVLLFVLLIISVF